MMTGILASAAVHLFVIVPFLTIWKEDSVRELDVFSVSIIAGAQAPTRARVDRATLERLEPVEKPDSGELNIHSAKTATPTPTPTPTPTMPPTQVPTIAPTVVPTIAVPTIAPTAVPTVTPRPTRTPVPTRTPRPTVTATQTARPKTPTPRPATPTVTPRPTRTPKGDILPKKNMLAVVTPAVVETVAPPPHRRSDEDPDQTANDQYNRHVEKYIGESLDQGTSVGEDSFGAVSGGGVGGSLRPRSYFIYMRSIQRELKAAWTWHSRRTALKAEIEMRIARDGTIIFAQIAQSSGNREFDQSVMRAIRAVDPFPAPPAEVYDYFKHVILVFDPSA